MTALRRSQINYLLALVFCATCVERQVDMRQIFQRMARAAKSTVMM
jgi:hypothetical protein